MWGIKLQKSSESSNNFPVEIFTIARLSINFSSFSPYHNCWWRFASLYSSRLGIRTTLAVGSKRTFLRSFGLEGDPYSDAGEEKDGEDERMDDEQDEVESVDVDRICGTGELKIAYFSTLCNSIITLEGGLVGSALWNLGWKKLFIIRIVKTGKNLNLKNKCSHRKISPNNHPTQVETKPCEGKTEIT